MDLSSFVGLPYKDMGRDYSGVDCWGLVFLVYRDALDIAIPSYAEDCEPPFHRGKRSKLIGQEIVHWQRRKPGNERLGDAVLMRMGGFTCHVGLLAPRAMILHCEDGRNSVLEPSTSLHLKNRIEGFYWYDPVAPGA
jgi:cell wall-associated NlpC family hydrolase